MHCRGYITHLVGEGIDVVILLQQRNTFLILRDHSLCEQADIVTYTPIKCLYTFLWLLGKISGITSCRKMEYNNSKYDLRLFINQMMLSETDNYN